MRHFLMRILIFCTYILTNRVCAGEEEGIYIYARYEVQLFAITFTVLYLFINIINNMFCRLKMCIYLFF